MKAAFYSEGKVVITEVELKQLRDQWARLRVGKTGLCGTDLFKFSHTLPDFHTKILGHEFIGQVEDLCGLGSKIERGDWVAAIPLIPCGTCELCRQHRQNLCLGGQAIGRTFEGALSEYVDVPIANLVKIEGPLDCYVLADPLAVCVHAIRNAGLEHNQTCLVVGDGAIGGLLAWLLHQMGFATWIKGVHHEHLQFMEKLGVDTLTSSIRADRFDCVFETVGRSQAGTLDECLCAVKSGGRLVVLGVFAEGYIYPLAARNLFIREVELYGSNSYVLEDFQRAVELIRLNGKVLGEFITHRLPLSRIEEALLIANKKEGLTLKVLLEIGEFI
ncbi:MAG: hypothetical protein A3I29_01975 [Candidatus Magasanikbacteria bacterium RIFCSPLOWO2_02_FULL_44_11]|uniref:Uncharacterized protein n=1 Tax=Candidatus Magasanikbacteria bacterium RIFCSPLOWO2_02_FULL_44_11 TaxID=1798689 RepID=A0A1F6NAJ7_9BACT|nr:MAG: hypothetical protein A3I29_01975 [Candidatus Magasanikbacteria bacterium RIFCSPLOWO2_02_FULL_44_11]